MKRILLTLTMVAFIASSTIIAQDKPSESAKTEKSCEKKKGCCKQGEEKACCKKDAKCDSTKHK